MWLLESLPFGVWWWCYLARLPARSPPNHSHSNAAEVESLYYCVVQWSTQMSEGEGMCCTQCRIGSRDCSCRVHGRWPSPNRNDKPHVTIVRIICHHAVTTLYKGPCLASPQWHMYGIIHHYAILWNAISNHYPKKSERYKRNCLPNISLKSMAGQALQIWRCPVQVPRYNPPTVVINYSWKPIALRKPQTISLLHETAMVTWTPPKTIL